MRTLRNVVAVAVLTMAGAANAQLSRRSISLESGISAWPGGEGGPRATVALLATAWLEGPAEAVARLAFASAGEPGVRATAVSGTVGIRLSAGSGPLRPQLVADAGWARLPGRPASRDRFAWGLGAGAEWFPGLDLSLSVRGGVRSIGGGIGLELVAGVAAYF